MLESSVAATMNPCDCAADRSHDRRDPGDALPSTADLVAGWIFDCGIAPCDGAHAPMSRARCVDPVPIGDPDEDSALEAIGGHPPQRTPRGARGRAGCHRPWARRIVTGRDGEMDWTADHYDQFAWIAR